MQALYSQADARYLGAEARVDLAFSRELWLNLGFDVVDAQLQASRTPLPRIPPVRGRIGFDWNHGAFNVRPELLLFPPPMAGVPDRNAYSGLRRIAMLWVTTRSPRSTWRIFLV